MSVLSPKGPLSTARAFRTRVKKEEKKQYSVPVCKKVRSTLFSRKYTGITVSGTSSQACMVACGLIITDEP